MAELVIILFLLFAVALIIAFVAFIGWYILVVCNLLGEATKVWREMKRK